MLVDPSWQRRGIGTTLLESAIGRLRAAGVRRVHLGSGGQGYIWPGVPANHIGWAWLPAFYERLGYRRWRDYLMVNRSTDS